MKFKPMVVFGSIILFFLSSFLLILDFYESKEIKFLDANVAENLGLYDSSTHQSRIEQAEYYDSQTDQFYMGVSLNVKCYNASLDKPEFINIDFRSLFDGKLIVKSEVKSFVINSLKMKLNSSGQLIDTSFYWETKSGEWVDKYVIKTVSYSPILSSIQKKEGRPWIDKTVAKIVFINQENWQNKTLSTFLVKVKDSYLSVLQPTIEPLIANQVLDYSFFYSKDELTAGDFNDLMAWKQPLNENVIEFQKLAEFLYLKINFRVWETFTKRYLEPSELLKQSDESSYNNYSFTIFLDNIDTGIFQILNYR